MGPSPNLQYNQSTLVDSLHNINQQQFKQQSTEQERKLGNLSNETRSLDSNHYSVDAYYKRQPDGPILWFAGPPNNVIPDNKPVHSVSYLNWKKNKQ